MARILIVEDNEMNRDALSRHLKRRGFEVLGADTGAGGLALATTERPDLVLMDIGLPEMDGLEVTRRLKASPETRDIPIIALSAHAMHEDRDRALQAGCDDFDTKPVRLQGLLEKIESLLPGGRDR